MMTKERWESFKDRPLSDVVFYEYYIEWMNVHNRNNVVDYEQFSYAFPIYILRHPLELNKTMYIISTRVREYYDNKFNPQ